MKAHLKARLRIYFILEFRVRFFCTRGAAWPSLSLNSNKCNNVIYFWQALEVRLADLARSFEEATIDKNDQEGKAAKMDKSLDTAAKLHKVRY